jgi:hypothetical protein
LLIVALVGCGSESGDETKAGREPAAKRAVETRAEKEIAAARTRATLTRRLADQNRVLTAELRKGCANADAILRAAKRMKRTEQRLGRHGRLARRMHAGLLQIVRGCRSRAG